MGGDRSRRHGARRKAVLRTAIAASTVAVIVPLTFTAIDELPAEANTPADVTPM